MTLHEVTTALYILQIIFVGLFALLFLIDWIVTREQYVLIQISLLLICSAPIVGLFVIPFSIAYAMDIIQHIKERKENPRHNNENINTTEKGV